MPEPSQAGRSGSAPGGTDARVALGCTCPPEQIGPIYQADPDCPVHGLEAVLVGSAERDEWVTISTPDGLTARAATAEAAGRMIDRMRAR